MRNIIISLIAGLLVFSVAFSVEKGPIKAPKMVKQQRDIEPLPSMQANGRTYWNKPVTHELRNGAFATLIDSSGNGYGMVSSVTNPLDVNDDGNMFVSYRQYAGVGTTHGQLGGAFSEDGEEWDAYYNLNANGNPPWGGGSGVGNGNETTAQARYPSALASEDYPYAIWNEYTGLGNGYGGQLYWTYDQTGWDVGSFMYPEQVDLLWNDFKDLWLPSPSIMFNEDGEEGQQTIVVVSSQDWTRSNNYYFRTEVIDEDGYMVFGEEQIVIDEPQCLTPGDASGSYNTSPKISTGDNGFGVMGIIGLFPGGADGASDISNYHLPIFKITEDYGETWHGPNGDPADACDFYYIPNDVLDDMVANFPESVYSDPCDGYEYYIVDYWSYYDFDYKIDANGNPHILMSVVPSDDAYVFWIDGAGWYHFTIDVEHINNPGPVNSETGWNYSFITAMDQTWQFNANDGDTVIWQTMASLSFSKDNPDIAWIVFDAMNEYSCGTLADDGGTPDDPCDDILDYTGLSEDIFVVKSTDGGHTWFNPLNATNTVDDPEDYPTSWHGECQGGLLWCGPEENYPHAAHWSTEDEVYYMFQMPNWGFNEIGDLLGPDHMNRVYVGVAEVTDDSEDSYPPDCGDDAPDIDPGDTNFDGEVDVLDIVAIVNHILGSSELTGDAATAGDYNLDGQVDVLDIVAIVNLILGPGSREAEATSVKFIQTGNSVSMESNGYVGAVQMTIEHGPDFTLDITNDTVLKNVSAYHTIGNTTTLIVVTPTDGKLFTGTSEFVLSEGIAAGDDDYITSEIADSYILVSSYPNPFNPSTTISYTMGVGGSVDISIYNVMGQKVANLVNDIVSAGSHSVVWNGMDMNGVELSSGVYLMKVQTSNEIVSSKLTLMR